MKTEKLLSTQNSQLKTLVNMLGEQVLNTVLLPNQKNLNINNLAAGVYGIKLFIDNNIVLLADKFVKL
jgi:hypothetical protein